MRACVAACVCVSVSVLQLRGVSSFAQYALYSFIVGTCTCVQYFKVNLHGRHVVYMVSIQFAW